MVPLVREVVRDADTPLAAFAKVARPPFAFLLESLVGGERWARYTFLGTEPREVWRYRGRAVERGTRATGWRGAGETDDPIGHLAQRMRALPAVPVPGLPRFTGGAVGYLGYDLVRTIEGLPKPPADTLALPDAVLMIADTVVIIDNLFGRAIVVANVEVPAGAAAAERLRLHDAADARLTDVIARPGGRHALAPLADDKERAEHLMLVDLGRNDVGRVAQFGTVRVTDLLAIERYSHVQHLVSEVRGRLRDGYDALDVFKACFPAGTVTGAPKVRAMEIIDELEPERRGPYAGAVGYVGWGATNLDTAIAIRCALVRPDRVVVQAGAGIVADSDPAREFAETQAKAQAVLKALTLAKARD